MYIPLAARGNSIINWDRATTWTNFIRLLTRMDYGTFHSGIAMGQLPLQRLIQVQTYVQYVILDFTWVGIFLLLIGFIGLWRLNKHMFWLLLVAAFSLGPAFMFYASFPLVSRFSLATYERFLLPSYVLVVVVIGFGFSVVLGWVQRRVRKLAASPTMVARTFLAICFLYPLTMSALSVWKLAGFSEDRSAENLAMDVLTSLPKGSVLLLDRDTELFTSQYMRYVEHVRDDVVLLHAIRLSSPDYQQVVGRVYPTLPLPKKIDEQSFATFLQLMATRSHVFSTTKYTVEDSWQWMPYGLVYQLVKKNDALTIASMNDKNAHIWATVHNPASDRLAKYDLMLTDVGDIYASARLEFGKSLLTSNDFSGAKEQITKAIAYNGDTDIADAYMYRGVSEYFLKECGSALVDFETSQNIAYSPNKQIFLYEAMTYRDCVGDLKRAQQLFDRYSSEQVDTQTPLQKL